MLKTKQVIAMVAVKDLPSASKFYQDTLGFQKVAGEGDETITYRSGSCVFNIYRSDYAGTNKATALTWVVGSELEGIVRTLRARGVVFEQYQMPGMTVKNGVHSGAGMNVAWFKDPDGNILNIVSR